MPQGTVKEFDDENRTGTLLTDDQQEIAIDPTSMEGSGLRFLRLGQRVKFQIAEDGGRRVARGLRHVTF